MEFRKVLALRGPNIWANSPVLEAWVDLGPWADTSSAMVPGFVDRLMGWLPSLIEHECSEGHRGGFLVRLREGTYPAHILEHVALELQSLAGTPVGYGRARVTSEPGVYRVVVKYREEQLGRASLEAARRLILAALRGEPFDIEAALRHLGELYNGSRLGPATMAIIEAARARGIPAQWLDAGGQIESLVQLGHGARQHRILAARTDRTGSIAESISQDKELTKSLLRSAGVPVPEGRVVADAGEAWEAALELGLPVVVKPIDADFGRGVGLNLTGRERIEAAYASAREWSEKVLVERFALGAEHRLLVVADRVVAAVRREPAQVVGDGRSTVAQLVDEANRDPSRGDWWRSATLRRIPLDATARAVLAEQGYDPESVPPAGACVLMRRDAHWRDGGATMDVTDQVHPELAARARDAARIVGLDIAGIDLVARDIGRPLEEQGGVIVEVNAGPALRMHLRPSHGSPRPAAEAVLATIFPEGETGRIPLVAVTGVNGKTTTTRLVAALLEASGFATGMACTDGIYVGGRRIEAGDCAGPRSARAVLLNPKVEAAALECARGGILREGLGFDRCLVGVVTNLGEGDHLGLADVQTPEQLAKVKRTIVDVVLPGGAAVLKADDPLVAAMAGHCRGAVVYFCRDAGHPVVRDHLAGGGGRAVVVEDGWVALAEGPGLERLIALADVPLTRGGRVAFQVENVLAAVGAAWAIGLDHDAIRTALQTFESDMRRVPGRFNVLEVGGATVVVDFGHNPSALEALVETLDQFPDGRRTVVFSADGDRKDDAILRQSEIVGGAFDRVILYEEDVRNRGRSDGEIIALIRRGLGPGGRSSEVVEAESELGAIEAALRSAEPGDLVVILHDAIDASLAFIQRYLSEQAGSASDVEVATVSLGEGQGNHAAAAASS